jgi:hypothetical protein
MPSRAYFKNSSSIALLFPDVRDWAYLLLILLCALALFDSARHSLHFMKVHSARIPLESRS